MMPRKLLFLTAMFLSGCVRKPEPFSMPVEDDESVIFPLSVGRGLVKVEAREGTYELDGEVLQALMIVTNDLFPPGISNPPCWARREAFTYRFTRREDIIFVYVEENPAYCGRKSRAMDSGAKYAISQDGHILRRVIEGIDEDHRVWSLRIPDGGRVTVVTRPGVSPGLEDLETPDGGILKIVTEPVDMPGVMVLEDLQRGSPPVPEGSGVIPGMSMVPADAGERGEYRDGGSPDAGWDGGAPGEGE